MLDKNGNVAKSFNPGSVIRMTVGEMLSFANVNLDDRAPLSASGIPGDPPPFNRMTGALLEVDVELVNLGKESQVGDHPNPNPKPISNPNPN